MHDSTNNTVLVNIPSMPIIEHSTDIAFGALPGKILSPTPTLSLDTKSKSRHWEVQDFDWVREGDSPNWYRVDGSRLVETLGETEGEVGNVIDRALEISKGLVDRTASIETLS
jgi:hypothetical protein